MQDPLLNSFNLPAKASVIHEQQEDNLESARFPVQNENPWIESKKEEAFNSETLSEQQEKVMEIIPLLTQVRFVPHLSVVH